MRELWARTCPERGQACGLRKTLQQVAKAQVNAPHERPYTEPELHALALGTLSEMLYYLSSTLPNIGGRQGSGY